MVQEAWQGLHGTRGEMTGHGLNVVAKNRLHGGGQDMAWHGLHGGGQDMAWHGLHGSREDIA